MRSQFTFYKSFWESIEKLPTNKEKLQAYQIVCSYALEKSEVATDGLKPSVCALFAAIRPVLDTAHSRSTKKKNEMEENTEAATTCSN